MVVQLFIDRARQIVLPHVGPISKEHRNFFPKLLQQQHLNSMPCMSRTRVGTIFDHNAYPKTRVVRESIRLTSPMTSF